MIFKQIDEILTGKKTQTRRIRKDTEFGTLNDKVWAHCGKDGNARLKWQVGKQYPIIPKRGAVGIGRFIRLVGIRWQPLHDITETDAIAEGVASVAEYKALWESINGKTKGARWQDNPECWVLTFELVKD